MIAEHDRAIDVGYRHVGPVVSRRYDPAIARCHDRFRENLVISRIDGPQSARCAAPSIQFYNIDRYALAEEFPEARNTLVSVIWCPPLVTAEYPPFTTV